MTYGGAQEAEQEVTIRLDREDRQAHVCSTWPAWSRKLERLYGPPKRLTRRDGKVVSAFWSIPVKAVRVGRVPQARTLTPERRAQVTARLQKARSTRVAPYTDRERRANPRGKAL